MLPSHGEKIQMRMLIAKEGDGKTHHAAGLARNDGQCVAIGDVAGHPRARPRPAESAFDQITRHERDIVRVLALGKTKDGFSDAHCTHLLSGGRTASLAWAAALAAILAEVDWSPVMAKIPDARSPLSIVQQASVDCVIRQASHPKYIAPAPRQEAKLPPKDLKDLSYGVKVTATYACQRAGLSSPAC